MITLTTKGQQFFTTLGGGAVLGLALGFALWFPREKPPVETAQPAVRQQDSSLVLERAPDAKAKPAALAPKGETVARIVEATVQPTAPLIVHDTVHVPATEGATPAHDVVHDVAVICPPVRLELTLTDLPDGTHRVIASSPDGRVTGGLDIPVKNTTPPRSTPWSAGALYGSSGQFGPYVARDLGPVHVLAGAQFGGRDSNRALVGVGLRF